MYMVHARISTSPSGFMKKSYLPSNRMSRPQRLRQRARPQTSSFSGKYQTAVVHDHTDTGDNGIWYSTDYGKTWKPSNAGDKLWYSVAMSSNGMYQTAVVYEDDTEGVNGIWYSTDYGKKWTRSADADNKNWRSVAMNA